MIVVKLNPVPCHSIRESNIGNLHVESSLSTLVNASHVDIRRYWSPLYTRTTTHEYKSDLAICSAKRLFILMISS